MTLFACGGGGGGGDSGGVSGAATISSTNEKGLATAAAEGVRGAVSASAPLRETSGRSEARAAIDSLVSKLAAQPVNVSAQVCPSGGTATGDSNDDGSTITFEYNNCDTGFGVFDGSGSFSSTTEGDITTIVISYDISYISGGTTENLDYSSTCTTNASTGAYSCTYDSDVDGIDDRTYTVSDSSFTGDSSSGYMVSATVTDPDYGTFTIETTSPILFNCTNGLPSSGEIVFTDGEGISVTVTFTACDGFTIAYDGTSTPYTYL